MKDDRISTGRDVGRWRGAIPGKDSISKYTEDDKTVYMKAIVSLVTKYWNRCINEG